MKNATTLAPIATGGDALKEIAATKAPNAAKQDATNRNILPLLLLMTALFLEIS